MVEKLIVHGRNTYNPPITQCNLSVCIEGFAIISGWSPLLHHDFLYTTLWCGGPLNLCIKSLSIHDLWTNFNFFWMTSYSRLIHIKPSSKFTSNYNSQSFPNLRWSFTKWLISEIEIFAFKHFEPLKTRCLD